MPDSIAHYSAHRQLGSPATGIFGAIPIDADAVRSRRHESALHHDAESDARHLKVHGAMP
ncbi:MAG: hypothetical protein LBJ65_16510 [Burkholderia sp.]|jgi:hypothetical protein|uniref:hypothetical protein n=1 Tax=Burkholderia sp. TaxID=36773 RepID=UPI002822C59C|nr:hypothetical protein [Burkholderia sp.]MDR0243202.1 hypothetical protein [Burkholderia sp.]